MRRIRIIRFSKRSLWAAAFVLLLLVGAASAGLGHYAAVQAAPHKLHPVYKVDTAESRVAISFDASWGAENTLQILDILDEYGVKTTFFLVNIWLEDYPDMAKEIVARGHEIGLHSVTHPHFSALSEQQIREELEQNRRLIADTTGYTAELFRPPFGDYDDRTVSISAELGIVPVQWSIDSLDWKDLSAAEIEERVLKKIGAGDIVLFHNAGLHTPEALPNILAALAERGLQVVPVGELIYRDNWYVDNNGVQHMGGSAVKE
ncbi:MAG: polysaccharide deacetylase family protein [Firmicutes bacterium]|nr:polysaccharide deacetylase family protein [Bacillota bacterium]